MKQQYLQQQKLSRIKRIIIKKGQRNSENE
jgi:hypothetical protein